MKIIALFNRQKTRDLFDGAIILEANLLDIAELERIYSFSNHTISIRDYINEFNSVDDDIDNTIDFLPRHTNYKKFKKLDQQKRFKEAKSMFIQEYDKNKKKLCKTSTEPSVNCKTILFFKKNSYSAFYLVPSTDKLLVIMHPFYY